MVAICPYFQVHQPWRLQPYSVFDIGQNSSYFSNDTHSDHNNQKVMEKVAEKCYRPTTQLLLDLVHEHPECKVTFSFSGIALEQFEQYAPDVLQLFQRLADTGNMEILGETYHHSLAWLQSSTEFREQVQLHHQTIREYFGQKPQVFRNTELIYNNDLATAVEQMGYRGMLAEGADHLLGWRSPNFVYRPVHANMPLLLKNYRLSDDIAFRFSEQAWKEWPLTAPKFAQWVNQINGNGTVVNLFMDYETFGEHQWAETGIFRFLQLLPAHLLEHPDNTFVTPSEAFDQHTPIGEIDAPEYVSWADEERDLSAWLSNAMQHEAIQKLYALRDRVLATGDQQLITAWRRLQTSDHFYYMCTKYFADGDVHTYFNPYETPYDAFITFMNVLNDLELHIQHRETSQSQQKDMNVTQPPTAAPQSQRR